MEKLRVGDFDYERHGHGYATQRRADPRIASLVNVALGSARTIVNVGAGAGSYEPSDRYVLAVEPSSAMRAQRPVHLAPAVDASAEELPLDDDAVDAAMAMVTVHQWSNAERGLRELRRVSRGPVVVLTFDGDALDRFWLTDYLPEIIESDRNRFPPIDTICTTLGGKCNVRSVPVPTDCVDGFTEAYFARPESFLDPAVRRSQSVWGFIDQTVQERAIANLRDDLETGQWDERYGHWRTTPHFDGSLRLIVAQPDE